MRTRTALMVFALGVLSSCYDQYAQQSRIVREVQAQGAGDASTFTVPGLAEWFSHRPDLAKKIAGECVPLARAAGANWATSAEGTVCLVASRLAPPPHIEADQRIW